MALSAIPREAVDEIEDAAAPLENFSVTPANRRALVEIFEEVYEIAGPDAVEDLRGYALDVIDNKRHPKAHRLRWNARSLIVEKYDEEIPATSSLLKSKNG
jgi:hypothetical protein